jgi:hypothetical protein
MTILPRPSVSPLHSFASLPTHRVQPFSATLRAVWLWLTGRQSKPSKSEVQFEQRIVDLLAAELEDDEASLIDKPPIAPKRPRRIEDPR